MTDNVVDLTVKVKRRPHRATRDLVARAGLTRSKKVAFDGMVAAITADLAGDLTTIEMSLVTAFAGCSVMVQTMNKSVVSPDSSGTDIQSYAMAVSCMTRCARMLGLKRRQRDLTPDLNTYLSGKKEITE